MMTPQGTEAIRTQDLATMINERTAARAALELVLLFHRGGTWTPDDAAIWKAITGHSDATTKAMCDHIRKVLA